jgi:aminoglycoside phosphotransferase (APT) family kinase protein
VSELRASIPAERPWAFSLHQPPPEILSVLSAGNFTLLRIIRDDSELARHLDHAASSWRSECLVHGDIKSDNLLVSTKGTLQELHLVDWELVHFGDPAWDIACAYYDFLWPWLASVAWRAQPSFAPATFPIQYAQIALQAMWSAYRSTAGLNEADARIRLERAVEFCAVRMVQAAYEHAQEAASASPMSILLLQLAENVFGAPELAMRRLFGFANGVA